MDYDVKWDPVARVFKYRDERGRFIPLIIPAGAGGGAPAAHAATHKDAGSDALLLHELGDPTASVEFSSQQALNLRLENRTSDPVSPAEGQIWLRTDL
jgi:hypothetical protein